MAHFREQTPESSYAVAPDFIDDALHHLLASFSGPTGDPYPQATREGTPPSDIGINWNLFEATENTDLQPSTDVQAVAMISQAILERFDSLSDSDDKEGDRSGVRSRRSKIPSLLV